MVNIRDTLYTLAERAVTRLLPPARSLHLSLGRWIRSLERERAGLPRSSARPAPRQEPKRWRHLAEPRVLSHEEARAFTDLDDPGAVLEWTKMLEGTRWISNPFTLYNWQVYRRAMDDVGVTLPEVEPRRELAPVGSTPVDCRFDFEMPEFFAVHTPRDHTEPFEVELRSEGGSN